MQFLPHAALSSRAADFVRTFHHIVAPQGVRLSDLIRPSFWSHHTARLAVGDLVDVVAEDGSYDVTLRVIGKGTLGGAVMRPIRVFTLGEAPMIEAAPVGESRVPLPGEQPRNIPNPHEVDDVPGFKINHAPKTGWRVIRRADGIELVRKLISKDAAIAWAREHFSEIAA